MKKSLWALALAMAFVFGCGTESDAQDPDAPEPTTEVATQTPAATVPSTPIATTTATATPTTIPTPEVVPQQVTGTGNWERVEGENIEGKYVGYGLASADTSGFGPTYIFLRCGVGAPANDLFWVKTTFLLHGGDNRATVAYRFSGDSNPVSETWFSDEELDSSVAPMSGSAFWERLFAAEAGKLYMQFESLYDGDTDSATFEVDGIQQVLKELELSCD